MTSVRELYFIVLIVAIAALHIGLILSGALPPLASNSLDNILFSLASIAVVAYMGWSLSKLGLKKVAFYGFIATFCAFLVLCLAVFIGSNIHTPVLGIQVSSVTVLIIFLFFNALVNIFLGVFFAVAGAWVAQKNKPKKKIRKR